MIAVAQPSATGVAMPFFRNYPAQEYHAHNRNFDIICDTMGHTFVANFEGLLMYNGVRWVKVHTPGVSRVTSLYRDREGKLWFGGYNNVGVIHLNANDSISIECVVSDKVASDGKRRSAKRFSEVDVFFEQSEKLYFATSVGKVYRVDTKGVKEEGYTLSVEHIESLKRTNIQIGNLTYFATTNRGVTAVDENGVEQFSLSNETGLCSSNINAIAYDGNYTLWGATDNGVFRMSTSTIYTRFDEHDGLMGQVTTVMYHKDKLYVGTLQGLFVRNGSTFERIEDIHQACWQLAVTRSGHLLAATPEGVFDLSTPVRQLTTGHTLSVLPEDDGTLLAGEVGGIYRYNLQGNGSLIDRVERATTLMRDASGAVWAQTLYGETYCMEAGKSNFVARANSSLSLMMDYTDRFGNRWMADDDGYGLNLITGNRGKKHVPSNAWIAPFDATTLHNVCETNGVMWFGGTFGLIRFDASACIGLTTDKPKVYIRNAEYRGRDLTMTFSLDRYYPLGQVQYSYRLSGSSPWTEWDAKQELYFANFPYGRYSITVRARDVHGNISESAPYDIYIPYPFYLRWYSLLLYVLIIILVGAFITRMRMHSVMKEKLKLERTVRERTSQVVEQMKEIEQQRDAISTQKSEIERQSEQLQHTLDELRSTQQELIRREREATVGKLTQGLIDRILNPMNYINNFSHISIGLLKDLNENLRDMNDGIADCADDGKIDQKAVDELADLYDDSTDVIGMLSQNLDKIEQHGLSTTRILKSMEEMLRDRTGHLQPTDMCALLHQSCEMARKYYADLINKHSIEVTLHRPETPVMVELIPEYASKCFMSMFSNSFYAIQRQAERIAAGYKPLLTVRIEEDAAHGTVQIKIHDNGIGIEDSIKAKVFDPFFTTKPTAEASGVGLYLSQQIIQDYNGTISVMSEKYKYTEFVITLPISATVKGCSIN